jgi:hypothetical protein
MLAKIFLEIGVLNPPQLVCFGAGVWPARRVERAPSAENPAAKRADNNQRDESESAERLELSRAWNGPNEN